MSRKGEVVDIEQIKRRFEARAEDLKAKRKAHEEAVSHQPSVKFELIFTGYVL